MQHWNLNGELLSYDELPVSLFNRSVYYGDSLTEPLLIQAGYIPFWEEHYFHLMASMRKLRYQIPMSFTPEYLEEECLKLWRAAGEPTELKVEIQVMRAEVHQAWNREGGLHFLIGIVQSDSSDLVTTGEAELYKDHYLPSGMLANLSTPAPAALAVATSFALENDYADLALLNEQKQVVRSLHGLLFVGNENELKSPELPTGAPGWVVRKQALIQLDKIAEANDWLLEEGAISPFEIPKAKEVFTMNAFGELVSWKKYRKTVYQQFSWKEALESAWKTALEPQKASEEN